MVAALAWIAWASPSLAQAPAWWTERGVLSAGVADDYQLLNQGQLKQLAYAGWLEMEFRLSLGGAGGAGPAISALVTPWLTPLPLTDDYAVMNLGQLKNVAKPFYERLIALGFRDAPMPLNGQGQPTYPWLDPSTPNYQSLTDDYPYANVGQAKQLFSFDLSTDSDGDGMPNWWEMWRGLNKTSSADQFLDPDGDGLINLAEYLAGTDPHLPDTDGDGQNDLLDSRDSDGDGLSDGTEIAVGTNPTLVDTDGDGFWDGIDAAPLDPNIRLPASDPSDVTAPVIVLLSPAGIPLL